MNETILKFGFPATLVADYDHWVVLLRPAQPTLGALVLAAKSDATALSALAPAAFAELARVTADIESTLSTAVDFERINYLMLMMVDPHVHFHVLPRYDGARAAEGLELVDTGWPKPPVLSEALVLTPDQTARLAGWLRRLWPSAR